MALRRGPDEPDVATLADFSEMRVLRQEAIPRMNRVDIGDLRGADDAIDLEIALPTGRRANANRFVRQLHVQGSRKSASE